MFILMPVWKCLIYCCFVVSFESPTLFLFKIILAILVLLQFRVNFRISLSIYKEVSWDSDRDCTEPVNEVGEYYHLKDVKSSYSWRWGIFSTYLDFSFFFFLLSFHSILEALVYNLIVFNLLIMLCCFMPLRPSKILFPLLAKSPSPVSLLNSYVSFKI